MIVLFSLQRVVLGVSCYVIFSLTLFPMNTASTAKYFVRLLLAEFFAFSAPRASQFDVMTCRSTVRSISSDSAHKPLRRRTLERCKYLRGFRSCRKKRSSSF